MRKRSPKNPEAYAYVSFSPCSNYQCYCSGLACRGGGSGRYMAALWEQMKSEDDPLEQYNDTNLRRLISKTKNDAFLLGFSNVRFEYDFCANSTCIERMRLPATPYRIRLKVESEVRHAKHVRERRNDRRRMRRQRAKLLAKVRLLEPTVTPSFIREFFAGWKEVTGYGPRDTAKRATLVPAKMAIINRTIEVAKEKQWTYGVKFDPLSRNGYPDVVQPDVRASSALRQTKVANHLS
jgi:hypothetical protein